MADRFSLPVAVHLFLIRAEQVLLLRRFNTGFEDGNYSVVAGHLDGGEQLKSAMIREANEEVGIEIRPEDLAVVSVMHRWTGEERVDFFLSADRWKGEIVNREPDKCDDLSWFPICALPANTIPYVRRAIQNFCEDRWFDSFGWTGSREASSKLKQKLESQRQDG